MSVQSAEIQIQPYSLLVGQENVKLALGLILRHVLAVCF